MSQDHLQKLCLLLPFAAAMWISPVAADHVPNHVEGYDYYNKGAFSKAFQMWQRLANEGSANAEYNLGILYSRGEGVIQDHQKAFEWFHRAARRGLAASQIRIAAMYATGIGVETSPVDAYMWLLIGERSHQTTKNTEVKILHQQIMELIRQMDLKMTDEDKKTAERRAREWLPSR